MVACAIVSADVFLRRALHVAWGAEQLTKTSVIVTAVVRRGNLEPLSATAISHSVGVAVRLVGWRVRMFVCLICMHIWRVPDQNGVSQQSLEFVTETRILAEMKSENRGKKYFP